MNSSCKLDYETAQKINNIGKRLRTKELYNNIEFEPGTLQ